MREKKQIDIKMKKENDEKLGQSILNGQTQIEFMDKKAGDLLSVDEPIYAEVLKINADGSSNSVSGRCALGFGTLKVLGFDTQTSRVLYQYIWNTDTLKYQMSKAKMSYVPTSEICPDGSVLFMGID